MAGSNANVSSDGRRPRRTVVVGSVRASPRTLCRAEVIYLMVVTSSLMIISSVQSFVGMLPPTAVRVPFISRPIRSEGAFYTSVDTARCRRSLGQQKKDGSLSSMNNDYLSSLSRQSDSNAPDNNNNNDKVQGIPESSSTASPSWSSSSTSSLQAYEEELRRHMSAGEIEQQPPTMTPFTTSSWSTTSPVNNNNWQASSEKASKVMDYLERTPEEITKALPAPSDEKASYSESWNSAVTASDDTSEVVDESSSQVQVVMPVQDVNDTPKEVAKKVPVIDKKGRTERIMKKIPVENQATGAGGASTWEAFVRAEAQWAQLRSMEPFSYDPTRLTTDPSPQFVTVDGVMGNPRCWAKLREQKEHNQPLDYDIVVCGGTLGIFFASALLNRGHRVCVVEGGQLRGREQEWNISFEELLQLVALGVVSTDDLGAAIKTAFPACRSGFKNQEVTPLEGGYFSNQIGYECRTKDVLNLGVAPAILLERASQRFREKGGVVLEETRIGGVAISEQVGVALDLGEEKEPITARLVLDCMGNGSPISRQQRIGIKPDGICCVVGSCASGYDKATNVDGDIIYTFTKIVDKGEQGQLQYFWESFPVGIGRNGNLPGSSDVKTTYMFTYMDADQRRPSLESLMSDYWDLLPIYQPSIKNFETDLDIKRVLFAYFPTYQDSPLKPQWSRLLAVGDASGIQSPLSFGGFGALTRHLGRIADAVSDALENDLLHKNDLAEINAYTPNLSAAWMFQKAMSVRMGQKVDPDFVNRLLAVNFEVMDKMGLRTIKPFLQDVIRFDGLTGSLARSFLADPLFMPQIIAHVGLPSLIDWLGHVTMMGWYGLLDKVAAPVISKRLEKEDDPREKFKWRRRMEAWKFGSGNDYVLPEKN